MKPQKIIDCPTSREPMVELPPITLEALGKDITFLQCDYINIGGISCTLEDGQVAHVVMINIAAPKKSDVGLFFSIYPEAARDIADALNRVADREEAKALKGAPDAI